MNTALSRADGPRFVRYCALGAMHFETVQPEHLPLLHDWLRRDYARFWAMGHLSLAQLTNYVDEIQRSSHRDIALGMCNGEPAFLFEGYHPAHDRLADHYQVRPGDRGMHLLLAPASARCTASAWK